MQSFPHKLVLLKIAVMLLLLPYAAFGQQKEKVNVSASGKTVKEIFDRIERSSSYRFFYSDDYDFVQEKKTIKGRDLDLAAVMDVLLEGSGMTYKLIDGSKVVISPVQKDQSRSTLVYGVVSDKSGPLAGVVVLDKNGGSSTSTDENGRFEVDLKNRSSAELLFTCLGYKDCSYTVVPGMNLNVDMEEKSEYLDEVVLIGYSTVKRKDLTGAVASVNSDELSGTPSSSLGEMLRGRAAGVQVKSGSGQPGATPQITIRGRRSMSDGANEPLFIVDGSPVTGEEFSMVPASDIQSMEVLKDAAAQSIYGARAANGVILVSTKRGKAGRTVVTYDGYASVQSLWRNFDLYNAKEWYQLRAIATANDMGVDVSSLTPADVLTDAIMEKALADGVSTNWEKIMFGNAFTHNHEVGIRGGTERMKVSASAGYYDQAGVLKVGSGHQRGQVRLNLDYKFFDWLDLGVSTLYAKSATQIQEGNFYEFINAAPLGVAYNEDGSVSPYINTNLYVNPLYRAEHFTNKKDQDVSRINAYLDFNPLKGLVYRVNLSYANTSTEQGMYKDSEYPGGGAVGSIEDAKRQSVLVENIVNYEVPIANRNHRVHLTAMVGYDNTIYKSFGVSASEFPVDRDWNMIGDATPSDISRDVREITLLSNLLHAQYTFKDRYLLSASIRRDGSSKFGANKKWGLFPSVAAAWIISDEPWMKETRSFLDNLKLRASIGQVGNQNGINPYTTLGLAVSYPMEFGDNLVMGYLPGAQLSNPNLKWETTTSGNIGLDFTLADNRINGSIEGYLTSTKDLLVTRTINSSLGYSSILDNLGETRTQGFEFSLGADLVRKKNITWRADLNVAHSSNRIIKVNDLLDEDGNPQNDLANNWFVGSSINVYYDYVFDGIYQKDEFDAHGVLIPTIDTDGDGTPDTILERSDASNVKPGSIKLKDLNGDNKITDEDRMVIERDPKMIYSLSSSLKFYGFDLFVDMYAATGGKIMNPNLYDFNHGGTLQGRLNGIKVNYWTPDNPSNEFPYPSYSSTPVYISTLAYQNASYFRLRTLTLGYTLPQKLTSAMKISRLRLYATATNLLTCTQLWSYSPEFSPGSYPEARQFLFGMNLQF